MWQGNLITTRNFFLKFWSFNKLRNVFSFFVLFSYFKNMFSYLKLNFLVWEKSFKQCHRFSQARIVFLKNKKTFPVSHHSPNNFLKTRKCISLFLDNTPSKRTCTEIIKKLTCKPKNNRQILVFKMLKQKKYLKNKTKKTIKYCSS